jgi:GWxTD domain-containing protein
MNLAANMKKPVLTSLISLLLLFLTAEFYPNEKIEELPPKYKKWLTEEVVYIITNKEKEVFSQLKIDKDRDLFIEAFWKQRDPLPATAENEFEKEHYRRINYANQEFGRGTTRKGWQTDRGRTYIILGKPVTIESFGTLDSNVVPTEVWLYQGDFGTSLPSRFYVVFFQEEGMGDYIYYSPVRHGPRKLLESYDGDPAYAYDALSRVNRELADISRSLVPGEPSGTDAWSSISSELLLSHIAAFPQKRIQDTYAEKFLKFKSLIEVDHSVNYVGNSALVKVIEDKGGLCFVHYAIEPRKLSIGKQGDKFFVNLEVYGRVFDLQDNTIYQFQKKAQLDLSPEQIPEVKSKLFSFQDMFPMIPGHFKFDLLIKNPVSKEFTSTEAEIIISPSSASLRMSPLILSPRIEKIPSPTTTKRPFQFEDLQIFPSANNSFTPKDNLFVFFNIYGLTQALSENGTIEFSFFIADKKVQAFRKKINDYSDRGTFLEEFPLAGFAPEIYTVHVSVLDETNKEVLAERENFMISPIAHLPRAWTLFKIFPPLNDPSYSYILGTQLLNSGETEKAKALLEEAFQRNAASFDFALALASACFSSQEYKKVDEILIRFLEKAKEESKVYFLLGKSNEYLGQFDKAIYFFKKYLATFGTHLEILNSLGECYFKMGNREEALSAWKKSLEIAPEQEDLRKKIASLKKEVPFPVPKVSS